MYVCVAALKAGPTLAVASLLAAARRSSEARSASCSFLLRCSSSASRTSASARACIHRQPRSACCDAKIYVAARSYPQ